MALKVFSGTSNLPLAQEICSHLQMDLGKVVHVGRFTDGEVRIELGEGVRGDDVFVIQPTQAPAENMLELVLLIDALKRSSAERITAVIPYFGYACQDKRNKSHVPISVAVMVNLVQRAGAQRLLVLDIHNEASLNHADLLIDQLYATPLLVPACQVLGINEAEWTVVSSDAGRVSSARGFARRISRNLPVAIVDKRRQEDRDIKIMNVIGDVKGRSLLLFDDMIRTATTLIEDSQALFERGAKRIVSCATHLVCAGNAVDNIVRSGVEFVIGTNSLPFKPPIEHKDRFRIVPVGSLLGRAIQNIHNNESLSALFV